MEREAGSSSSNETYRECLRNHAASLGNYATDGCGEFTLDDTAPGELKCAACGCHRNFHRKISIVVHSIAAGREVVEMIEYGGGNINSVDSPHEIERSGGKKRVRTKFTVEQKEKMLGFAEKLGWKMIRIRKDHHHRQEEEQVDDDDDGDDEDEIQRFCRNVGVSRQVFKVWMHNHKNIYSSSSPFTATAGNASSLTQ